MPQAHLAAKRNASTMLCTAARAQLPKGDKVEVANADKSYGWRVGYCAGCAAQHEVNQGRAEVKPAEFDLAGFAARVVEVAKVLPAWLPGSDRVFISRVARSIRIEWGLTMKAFQTHLLEANRRRLLSLSRADLVSVMDPKDVAESEIRHYGATFHFIAL